MKARPYPSPLPPLSQDFEQPAYGQTIAARKTAIYADAALLFLGSAVASAPGSRVTTTVESRLLASDGVVAAGLGGRGPLGQLSPGTHILPAPAAGAPLLVYHGGTGYVFPVDATGIGRPGASASVFFGPVTGSWEALNGDPNAPNVTNEMFTLVLDHGDHPVAQATYGECVRTTIWPRLNRLLVFLLHSRSLLRPS